MALKIDFPIKIETVETYDRYRIKKPVPIAVQGDDIGRRLVVSFTQKGKPIDISSCSAQVKCSYNETLIAVNNCEIENNAVVVTLTSSMLANSGEHKLQVSLFDENHAIVSGNIITIQVTESLPTGDVESTEDFSALSALTAQIKSLTISDAELKGARGSYPLLSTRLNATDTDFANLTRFYNSENLINKSADSPSAATLTDGYYAENCQLTIEDECVALQSNPGGDCSAFALFKNDFTINSDGRNQMLTAMRIKSVGKSITVYPIGGIVNGEKSYFCNSNIVSSNYNKTASSNTSITLTQDKWITVWGLIGGNGSTFNNGSDEMSFNGLGVYIPVQSGNSAPKLLIQSIKAYSGNGDIQSSLTAIEDELTKTNNAITSIQSNLNSNNQSVSTIQTELSTISGDVSTLANTVNTNTTDITSMKTTSSETETKLSDLMVKGIQHDKDIESMQTQLLDNEEKVTDIEENITTIQGNISGIDTNIEDIKALLGLYEQDVLGLQVDYQNRTFTRLAGAVGKISGADFDNYPMYGGRKRCNVADDGTINAYFGDDSYTEDGSNGQVMVYQPKFYYKVVPLKLEKIAGGIGYHIRKANYYVSDTPHEGFKVHPVFFDENGDEVEYVLFSAYEGCIYDSSAAAYLLNDEQIADTTNDKFASIAGATPATGTTQKLTRHAVETMAKNRGAGWHSDNIKSLSANQLLTIIEMGTLNIQSAIGQGVVSGSAMIATGTTASLGNVTGVVNDALSNGVVSYRGVENPWGNIWKFVDGINFFGNGNMLGGQPYICADYNYEDSKTSDNYKPVGFYLSNDSSSYISSFGYSQNFDWLFLPTECIGTSALPVGDYATTAANLNSYKIMAIGSRWNTGLGAGPFYAHCSASSTTNLAYFGARLFFVPTT